MEDQNSYTEVTTESWGSRIIGSIKLVLFGVILFLGAFVVLWWNEGRAIKTEKGLEEGNSLVIPLDGAQMDEANSGKLVHLSGEVISNETLVDEEFGFELKALKLKRNVSMYQWVEDVDKEKKKEVGGSEKTTTTYNYKMEWSNSVINSGDFKIPEGHTNPSSFPYSPYTQQVGNATIGGGYVLSQSLLSKINDFETFQADQVDLSEITNASLINEGETSYVYIGSGTNLSPQIGDIKVSFQAIAVGNDYSLIARQVGNTFEKFITSTETSIEMISPGVRSSESMFAEALRNNSMLTWALRVGGFFLMAIGLSMVFKPLVVIADVLPFLGNLLDMGLSLFSGIVSFSLSFVTIAIAWIFYRPVLGVSLLAVGLGAFIFFSRKASKRKKQLVRKKAQRVPRRSSSKRPIS